jgi:hypothetical protein
MNLHQHINAEIERQYEAMRGAILISPTALAHRVFEGFSTGEEDPHVQYTSLEHLKQMVRGYLAKSKEPDGDDSDAYVQASLDLGITFSGKLQDRYPLPRKAGEEPVYKLRSELTADERAWNVALLRKSGQARLEHADALAAEGQMRASA